jgi:hypothetical protein
MTKQGNQHDPVREESMRFDPSTPPSARTGRTQR